MGSRRRQLRPLPRGGGTVLGLLDDEVRAAQERVDQARLSTLESIWMRLVDNPSSARTVALIPHLLAIGGTVVFPPLDRARLADVFELLGSLIPAATEALSEEDM